MTDYFVASGGSNTSPYDTWAKAATSLATALAAASTDGDRVIIQYDGVPSADAENAGDTTYTAAASIELICSTNSGTNTVTPTAMGTSYWIGNSTASRTITIASATNKLLYVYGLTIRSAGTDVELLYAGTGVGQSKFDNCYFWLGNTNAGSSIALGGSATGGEYVNTYKDCTFRFGDAAQLIKLRGGSQEFHNCSVSSSGSQITTLFSCVSTGGSPITLVGCDLSYVNTTLVGDQTIQYREVRFIQCKLPASYTALGSQTAIGRSSCDVYVLDCHSGDEHIHLGHYNGLGSTVMDTGIYANDNIADSNLSWKIIGTSTATPEIPYESPWIEVYHTATDAITPYLECARSGSATAYDNDEVWSNWTYKGTASSTKATFVSDGVALAGTPAAQTNSSKGASDWTGENATSWFGKLAPTVSITPAEAGHICARVCVAGANTVYVDPQIRGLS